MADVKSFVIDRAKWGKEALLNSDGSMCCLGFYSEACGANHDRMLGYGVPRELEDARLIPVWARYSEYEDNDIKALIEWNDHSHGPGNSTRRCKADVEKAIAKIFKRNGVRVTFKGKAVKS